MSELFCNLCAFVTPNYGQWLVHISSQTHQAALYNSPGHGEAGLEDEDVRDKVVLASDIRVGTKLKDVAQHFSQWGRLVNFIYKGAQNGVIDVILVYDDRKSVGLAIRDENLYLWGKKIFGRPLFVPWIEDVPQSEPVRSPITERLLKLSKRNSDVTDASAAKKLRITNGIDFPTPMEMKLEIEDETTEIEKSLKIPENLNAYGKLAVELGADLKDVKLEEQINAFLELLRLSPEKIDKRVLIGDELLSTLRQSFEDCAIFPFGLDFLGIATDVDGMIVMVDPFAKLQDDKPVIFQDPESQTAVASEIFNLLKKEQYKLNFCRDAELTSTPLVFSPETKIPKITFTHRKFEVKVSIFVENFLLVKDTHLIKFLTSLDPRLHPILCLVRFFASVYNLLPSEDESWKNHTVIWILFAFLAQKKIIPSVNDLFVAKSNELLVNNIDIEFSTSETLVRKSHDEELLKDPQICSFSTISLLQEFFAFCGSADLKRNVICPVVDRLVPLNAFGKKLGVNFPKEILGRYTKYANGTPRAECLYVGCPLALQHPLDLVTNLGRNVTLQELGRFQELTSKAGAKLNMILQKGEGDLMELFINLPSQVVQLEPKIANTEKDEEESSDEDESDDNKIENAAAAQQKEVDSPWEMDTEDEENPKSGDRLQKIRNGKIRVNQNLRRYFEDAIAMMENASEIDLMDVRKKFQSLWFQLVLEFNSKFFSTCFGLEILSDSNFQKEEYAKIDKKVPLSLGERFSSIKTETTVSSFEYRLTTSSSISPLLYKKKVWKRKFFLANIWKLWALLTGGDNVITKSKKGPVDASELKKMIPLPKRAKRMEFSCTLDAIFDFREEEELSDDEPISAFVTVYLRDTTYADDNDRGAVLRAQKLRYLVKVYEKLAGKYINLRMKQWLETCWDFDIKKFDREFQKKAKRIANGHPKWRKFKGKWQRMLKERKQREKILAQLNNDYEEFEEDSQGCDEMSEMYESENDGDFEMRKREEQEEQVTSKSVTQNVRVVLTLMEEKDSIPQNNEAPLKSVAKLDEDQHDENETNDTTPMSQNEEFEENSQVCDEMSEMDESENDEDFEMKEEEQIATKSAEILVTQNERVVIRLISEKDSIQLNNETALKPVPKWLDEVQQNEKEQTNETTQNEKMSSELIPNFNARAQDKEQMKQDEETASTLKLLDSSTMPQNEELASKLDPEPAQTEISQNDHKTSEIVPVTDLLPQNSESMAPNSDSKSENDEEAHSKLTPEEPLLQVAQVQQNEEIAEAY